MAKIIMLGDSTVSSFNDVTYFYPRYGYGVLLSEYVKDIEIINLALSGRSSKSFIVEDNYKKYLSLVNEGDFVIIGFGHNDEKADDIARFTNASLDINQDGSFKKSLYDNYIKIALDKKATPIICSPIPRLDLSMKYEGNLIHINEYGDYKKAVLDLAKELNITGVDLTTTLVDVSKKLGDNQLLLHAISKGKKVNGEVIYDERSVDKTHLSYFGAKWVSYLLAKELKRINHPISKYFKELDEPKLADLKVNPKFVFKEYKTPDFDNYKPTDNYKCNLPFYGTAFGSLDKISDEIVAKSDNDSFLVGSNITFGKLNASSDGFAYAFTKIDKNLNFKFSAHAKIEYYKEVKQSGFGLMLRGDVYLNQTNPIESYSTNYIAAGIITTDLISYVNFSRSNPTELNKELNVINEYYKEGEELDITIERLGQVVYVNTIYRGVSYKNQYIDFDYLAMDEKYIYVGMFANKQTIVRFSNVELEIKNKAKEA